MSINELLTTSQVVDRLGVTRQAVARMVAAGDLVPEARISVSRHGSFVFSVAEVDRAAHSRAAEFRAEAERLESTVNAK